MMRYTLDYIFKRRIVMDRIQKQELWMTDPYFDEETRKELKAIEGEEAELYDRFYKDLDFGTGGLRGVIGAGTNRMNCYTIRKATQGLANFIIKEGGQEKGVAIAYDSRHMSQEFSDEAALCLNANGIKTYRFSSLRPTPELSFTVRELLALLLPLVIILQSIMDIKCIGKMAHRSLLRKINRLLQR